MHNLDRILDSEDAFVTGEAELDPEIFEMYGETGEASPLSEEEELALAHELLGVSDEAELDQFLGKLIKRFAPRLKQVLNPLGKILKPVAKRLLPIAGRAAGTFFGGPLGGAVGGKLGSLASRLFEVDLESMDPEVQELEVAQRFVRLASTAARNAAVAPPAPNPVAAARSAVAAAARVHAPGLLRRPPGSAGTSISGTSMLGRPGVAGTPLTRPCRCGGHGPRPQTGRWLRRPGRIVLLGV